MDERICHCGHDVIKHEHMDQSVGDLIAGLVKAGTLIPQHHPDKFAVTGYLLKDTPNHQPVSYDQIVEVLSNIRATQSRCKEGVMFGCHCEVFIPDNLLYLERLSERKTSQIIH